ncbi:MAG TPA: HNH endonuclease signature motif containing protein [Acidimicrobiales bacterium]
MTTILCDIRAWRRGHTHEGEPCHIVDGGPITPELAKELAKDAFINAVLHDGVDIIKLARFGRHIPAHLRAALDIGDPPDFDGKKCADCGKRHRLQLDHVDPVANNGPTSYKNLQPRCYTDHQAKTEQDRKAGLLKRSGRPRGDRQESKPP